MKRSKKIISAVFACISIACVIAAAVIGIRQHLENIRSENTFDDLRASVDAPKQDDVPTLAPSHTAAATPEPTPAPDKTPEPTPVPTETPKPTPAPVPNPYRDAFLANSDMAAWIQIPGTVIDYPVMWTPRDEEYYLYRGFDGAKNQNGCLILDTDSSLDPQTTNLIIHGHNMKSGAMFGHLLDYEDAKYYEDHKLITLYTETVQRNYEIIAVFRSQIYKKSDKVFKFYNFFQADTQEEFDDFYQNIKALSLYDTGVTAEFGDTFITLTTCCYHVENGRFVVVGRETASGDTYAPFRE